MTQYKTVQSSLNNCFTISLQQKMLWTSKFGCCLKLEKLKKNTVIDKGNENKCWMYLS